MATAIPSKGSQVGDGKFFIPPYPTHFLSTYVRTGLTLRVLFTSNNLAVMSALFCMHLTLKCITRVKPMFMFHLTGNYV